MDGSKVVTGAFIAGCAALGAASTIAIEKVVTKLGIVLVVQHHHFQAEFGVKNMPLLGVIGAIQTIATLGLGGFLLNDDDYHSFAVIAKKMFIANLICASTLVILTTIAEKTNLIANRLTVFAGVMMLTNSLILNISLITVLSDDVH